MSQAPDITGVEGERLDATVTVDSAFSSQETQTIELRVEDGGTTVHTDTQSVTLADNTDSQQITLSWPTSSGDAGTYDLFIESEDDTVQALVAVESGGATRQDAIAAADTWWEPSTSGWNSVKGRSGGSGGGTFVTDHFGTGLDARRADENTSETIAVGNITLPFVFVGVVEQQSPVGFRSFGIGEDSNDGLGFLENTDISGFPAGGSGLYIHSGDSAFDVTRVGDALTGQAIYAQQFTASDTESLAIDFSGSASLSYVTFAPHDFDFLLSDEETDNNNSGPLYHSEFAIVEGTATIPQDIKDYFTNNYGGS